MSSRILQHTVFFILFNILNEAFSSKSSIKCKVLFSHSMINPMGTLKIKIKLNLLSFGKLNYKLKGSTKKVLEIKNYKFKKIECQL